MHFSCVIIRLDHLSASKAPHQGRSERSAVLSVYNEIAFLAICDHPLTRYDGTHTVLCVDWLSPLVKTIVWSLCMAWGWG